MDDEFPLSMFYEALRKKMGDVIESTAGLGLSLGFAGHRSDGSAIEARHTRAI